MKSLRNPDVQTLFVWSEKWALFMFPFGNEVCEKLRFYIIKAILSQNWSFIHGLK